MQLNWFTVGSAVYNGQYLLSSATLDKVFQNGWQCQLNDLFSAILSVLAQCTASWYKNIFWHIDKKNNTLMMET